MRKRLKSVRPGAAPALDERPSAPPGGASAGKVSRAHRPFGFQLPNFGMVNIPTTLEKLVKRYRTGHEANRRPLLPFRSLTFSVRRSEIASIMGCNGANRGVRIHG